MKPVLRIPSPGAWETSSTSVGDQETRTCRTVPSALRHLYNTPSTPYALSPVVIRIFADFVPVRRTYTRRLRLSSRPMSYTTIVNPPAQ